MTIFLEVLRSFISKELDALTAHLSAQMESLAHNIEVSRDQKEQVDKLRVDIIRYNGTQSDEKNRDEIIKFIADHTNLVEEIRRNGGVSITKSDTLTALSNISRWSTSFFNELETFKFKLLDIPYNEELYKKSPNIVVYHAVATWLAQQIFDPLSLSDEAVRTAKKGVVQYRLEQLDGLLCREKMKKDQSNKLTREIDIALRTCDDLCLADGEVKKSKSSDLPKRPKSSLARYLPAKLKLDLTVWGVSLTGNTKLWHDRLYKVINEARTKLQKLLQDLESSNVNTASSSSTPPIKPSKDQFFNTQPKLTKKEPQEQDEDEDEDENENDDARSVNSVSSS